MGSSILYIALISASGGRTLLQAKGRWQLRLDFLVDICIADFDFNGNNLKLRCIQICTTNLYFILTITLKPQLTQILKHKQLKYSFRSLHVRAADKNVYLLITRQEISCMLRKRFYSKSAYTIQYIGIIDFKNPTAYS